MTAHERILTRLRTPGWHLCTDFGQDYHKLASRVSEWYRGTGGFFDFSLDTPAVV